MVHYKLYKPIRFRKYIPENCRVIRFIEGPISGDIEVGEGLYATYNGLEQELTVSAPELIYSNEDCSGMFSFLTELETLDFSNFDTTYAIDMNNMFAACWNLVNVDLNNFKTDNVINMSNMFDCCKSVECLDLTSFNLDSLEEEYDMFVGCYCLKDIKVSEESKRLKGI